MGIDGNKPNWLGLATADQETMFFENEGRGKTTCIDAHVPGSAVVEFSNRVRREIADELKSDGAEPRELLDLLDSPWWHLAGAAQPKPRFSPLPHSLHLRFGMFSDKALMDLQDEAGGLNLEQMLRITHLRRAPLPEKLLEEHKIITGERGERERLNIRSLRGLIPDLQICSRSNYLEQFGRKPEFEPLLPLRHQRNHGNLENIRDMRNVETIGPAAIDKHYPLEEAVKINGVVQPHLLVPALLYGSPTSVSHTLRDWAGAQIGILKDQGDSYLYSLVRAAMKRSGETYERGIFDKLTPSAILQRFIELRASTIPELRDNASRYRGRDRLKRRALIEPARMPELEDLLLKKQ